MGVDFFEIRDLVNQVESRNLHLPGGGVGGHCIPKDTWLLAYGSRGKYTPEFLLNARKINDNMPLYVSKKVISAAKYFEINPLDAKVSVLGLSYLEESDDTRNSPTITLLYELKKDFVNISIHDHIVNKHPSVNFSSDLDLVLFDADIIIIMVAHKLYKKISPEYLDPLIKNKIIIDTRNILDVESFNKNNYNLYSLGRGNVW